MEFRLGLWFHRVDQIWRNGLFSQLSYTGQMPRTDLAVCLYDSVPKPGFHQLLFVIGDTVISTQVNARTLITLLKTRLLFEHQTNTTTPAVPVFSKDVSGPESTRYLFRERVDATIGGEREGERERVIIALINISCMTSVSSWQERNKSSDYFL